jgi:hypothetical protein
MRKMKMKLKMKMTNDKTDENENIHKLSVLSLVSEIE